MYTYNAIIIGCNKWFHIDGILKYLATSSHYHNRPWYHQCVTLCVHV